MEEEDKRSKGEAEDDSGNKETVNLAQSDIENQLRQKLSALQSEYNGKLAGLIASAQKEYRQAQAGQKEVSKKELLQKYMNLADSIESQCDARVYAAIAYTENELAEYGYQSTVPEQARKIYQESKKERRKQLLNRL